MDSIALTLNSLSFAQMALAWLFVACYALALGGMLGPQGRWRAAALALLAGVVFSALCDDWTHGVLLVLLAVLGMAMFIAAAWGLTQTSVWLVHKHSLASVAQAQPSVVAQRPHKLHALLRSLVAP